MREPLPVVAVGLSVRDRRGITVLDEVWGEHGTTCSRSRMRRARSTSRLTVPPLLPAGDYVLGVWIGSSYDSFLEQEVLRFRVWPKADDPADALDRDRVVQPPVRWDSGRPSEMTQDRGDVPVTVVDPDDRPCRAAPPLPRVARGVASRAPAEILVVDQSRDPAVAALVGEVARQRVRARAVPRSRGRARPERRASRGRGTRSCS